MRFESFAAAAFVACVAAASAGAADGDPAAAPKPGVGCIRPARTHAKAHKAVHRASAPPAACTVILRAEPQATPAPSIVSMSVTSGSDSCMGGGSAMHGAHGQIGTGLRDDNCELLKSATLLWNMGKQDAAIAMLCGDRRMRDALDASRTPCPGGGRPGQHGPAASLGDALVEPELRQ